MKLAILVVFAVLIAYVSARNCDARRGLVLSRPGRCCEWTCGRHSMSRPIQACVNTRRRLCICNPKTHCRNLRTDVCHRIIRKG